MVGKEADPVSFIQAECYVESQPPNAPTLWATLSTESMCLMLAYRLKQRTQTESVQISSLSWVSIHPAPKQLGPSVDLSQQSTTLNCEKDTA